MGGWHQQKQSSPQRRRGSSSRGDSPNKRELSEVSEFRNNDETGSRVNSQAAVGNPSEIEMNKLGELEGLLNGKDASKAEESRNRVKVCTCIGQEERECEEGDQETRGKAAKWHFFIPALVFILINIAVWFPLVVTRLDDL